MAVKKKVAAKPAWEKDAKTLLGTQVRNLVFEGGGVWGIAYAGALAELERVGLLRNLERAAGASAGAITACLLATGHTADDLRTILAKTQFDKFQDDSFGLGRDTHRLLTEFGWFKGDWFREWIRELIKKKTRALSRELGIAPLKARPTFRDLIMWQRKAARRGHPLPQLYLIGTNLSAQRREVYSAEARHSPKMLVEDAVRASMSIPLFFACTRGSLRKKGGKGDVLVDGGLTWNYPVNVFDDKRYVTRRKHGMPISYAASDTHVFNAETLGFRLDTTAELEANLRDWQNKPVEIDNIIHYGWALVALMRAVANKVHLHQNDWSRTVFVDVGEDIGFTKFELTPEEIKFLEKRGLDGMRAFLRWRVSKGGIKELQRIYAEMAG